MVANKNSNISYYTCNTTVDSYFLCLILHILLLNTCGLNCANFLFRSRNFWEKTYFMFNSLKWRNFGWIPVISKVVESFLIPKLKTNKMSTTRRASILTRQGRHLIIYRVEGSRIMAHLNHHFSAVMYTYVLSISIKSILCYLSIYILEYR